MILFLIAAVIFLLLEILSGFLPPVLSIVAYTIFYIMVVVLFITILILLVIRLKRKEKVIELLIGLVITIFSLVFSYKPYNIVHNYNEVRKSIDKDFGSNYKILNTSSKNIRDEDDDCDYVFDIRLNDNSNIIFQAGYCEVGVMWTSYDVINNYIDYYLPYYYSLYKKDNNISFRVENNKIIYNNSNREEVYNFINYLIKNTNDIKYQFAIFNEETNDNYYVSSWNDFYKSYLNIYR